MRTSHRPLLGAHMSVAGGFYRAVEAAAALGMGTVQIFTVSPQIWPVPAPRPPDESPRKKNRRGERDGAAPPSRPAVRPIDSAEVTRFRAALETHQVTQPLAHSSYLINLASGDPVIWQRSIDALSVELERATALGVGHIVVHPGAAVGLSDEQGLANIVRALDAIHAARPPGGAEILLENTAGQGSCLGWQFAHLGVIIEQVQASHRLGVCIDTCHALAAGYPLAAARDYRRTWDEFERTVGSQRIRAFHLNDSVKPLGSRVDRHAHIGHGHVGREAFRRILRDPRFRDVPMYLETPKGDTDGTTWDAVNLAALRELAGK